MQKRIPQILIAIFVIIRVCIAVNTHPDGILYQGANDSSIKEETVSKSLIGETVSITTFAGDSKKATLKGFLSSVIPAFITALFLICIGLLCFAGIKMVFKQGRNNLSGNSKGGAYPSRHDVGDPQTPDFSTVESKAPIVRYIPSNHTKCPSCGDNYLKRIPRKWYMRLIPGSKRYLCRICRSKFTIFLWKITICG